jgi:SHS family lactate transporter-like MFS transporter
LKQARAEMSANLRAWWREPTRGQWLSFSGAWCGWVLDAFDFTIFFLAMPKIEREFGVSSMATSASLALTLTARLVGGWLAGIAADRWGRKWPLVISILWFAICDGLVAFAPSFGAILVLRTLFGLGMGAEWTAGTTLAMENWPKRSRGIESGILQGSWAIGYLLASQIWPRVFETWGWRAMFLIAASPAVLCLFIRYGVPESEEWSKARAEKKSERTAPAPIARGDLLRAVWGTFAMALGLGVYYALTGLYPTMLEKELSLGASDIGGLVALFNVGMLVGSVATGFLAYRRGTSIAILVPASLAVLVIPLYVGFAPGLLGVGAFLGGMCGVGFCGVVPLLLTSLFSAEHRGKLVGIVYHAGAALAAYVPLAIATLARGASTTLSRSMCVVAVLFEIALVVLVVVRLRSANPDAAVQQTSEVQS